MLRRAASGELACQNVGVSILSNQLSFNFNGSMSYTLFGVLEHIRDFSKGAERVPLYLEIVDQVSSIFDLGFVFSQGLIKRIKQSKSKKYVEELLAPFSRYVKVDYINKNRLATIT